MESCLLVSPFDFSLMNFSKVRKILKMSVFHAFPFPENQNFGKKPKSPKRLSKKSCGHLDTFNQVPSEVGSIEWPMHAQNKYMCIKRVQVFIPMECKK